MPEENQEVIRYKEQRVPVSVLCGTVLEHYSTLPSIEGAMAVATFPVDTEEGRIQLHNLITSPSHSIWDLCEKGPIQFAVRHLAFNFGEYESEEKPGEIITGPIMHLIGDKTHYHSGSMYAFRSLQQLASLLGPPPWQPPVVLEARRQASRKRHIYQQLSCVGREV